MLSLPHGRVLLIVGWLLVILTIAGSLSPALPKMGVSISDKLMHFASYFALTLWFAGLYPRSRLWIIAVAFFLMGAALEVLQGALSATRVTDVIDLGANTLGIIVAAALALLGLSAWTIRLEAWLTRRAVRQ